MEALSICERGCGLSKWVAREAVPAHLVRSSQPPPPPPALVVRQTLNDAEDLYTRRDLEAARSST